MRTPGIATIALLAGGTLAYQYAKGVEPIAFVISAVVIAVSFGTGVALGFRKQVAQWTTFRLTLSDDSIARRIDGFEDVTIRKSDVTSVREVAGRGILVVAKSTGRQIFFHDELEGFGEVRDALATWTPITVVAPVRWMAYAGPALGIVLSVLILVHRYSDDPRVVVSTGALVAFGLVWSCVTLLRSPDAARWAKLWTLVVVPMLFGVMFRMWSVL